MPKILLDTYHRTIERLFPPAEMTRLRSLGEIVWGKNEAAPADFVSAIRPDIDAIICGGWRYGSVAEFSKVRAVLEVGGTLPSTKIFDYPHCFANGIRVLSCAPGFAPAVAEMALGMAIASGRRIVSGDSQFRTGEERWGSGGAVEDVQLFDRPVGFIGFGNLARVLKSLLTPFRCPISVYDPWLTDAHLTTQGVTPVSLDELLSSSSVIFVLATPSSSNRALLDRNRLELIKSNATLVLISRAHLVDFDALTEMVLDGKFSAAIDVFPEEPLPQDHPIRSAQNAILSAHRAGGGDETYRLIGRMVTNDLEAVLSGRPPVEMQSAQPEYIAQRGP